MEEEPTRKTEKSEREVVTRKAPDHKCLKAMKDAPTQLLHSGPLQLEGHSRCVIDC